MKNTLIFLILLLVLVKCTENEISPDISGKLKRTINFVSSDLSKPRSSGLFFYNNSGLLIKTQSFDSEAVLASYTEYEYDNQDNLIRKTTYESISGKMEKASEQLFFFNAQNLNHKTEYYENGSIVGESYHYYTEFGKLELNRTISYPENEIYEFLITYDQLERELTTLSNRNDIHQNSNLYEYSTDGLDRLFWTFFGEDSVLWLEGEEKYVDDKIQSKKTFNYVDSSTYYNRYYYNEYNDLLKETFEKDGIERLQIENEYNGELLIESKRYHIDFSEPTDEYYLTIYEYY